MKHRIKNRPFIRALNRMPSDAGTERGAEFINLIFQARISTRDT